MGKHDALSKTLAILGVILLALPLVAPLAFSLGTIGAEGGYRLDFLMPFEVYPVALVGTALVVWASLRAHLRRLPVWIAVGAMFGGLVLLGVSAKVTGIADSPEQLEAWRYIVTAAFGVISLVGQAGLAVVGSMIAHDLFAEHDEALPLTPATGS